MQGGKAAWAQGQLQVRSNENMAVALLIAVIGCLVRWVREIRELGDLGE